MRDAARKKLRYLDHQAQFRAQGPSKHYMTQPHAPQQTKTRYRLSVREKLLSLALVVVSTFSLSQMGAAQKPGDDTGLQYADAQMQPSERADDNFPGSAFYYLDNDVAMLSAETAGYDWEHDATNPTEQMNESLAIGPAAPPTRATGSALDRSRALQCLTTAIYYEAALEPDAGQRAVAQVILNRVRHPSYPDTVCGVIYQGSERRTGCQFSYSCDGSMARTPSRFYWDRARRVAQDALSGKVYAPAGLATHYHTTEIYPYWAPSLHFLGTIGAHRFYRWRGSAGQKSAFNRSYRGGEPTPRPKPKAYNPKEKVADPIALAKAYEDARKESLKQAEIDNARSAEAARLAQPAPVGTVGTPAPKAYAAPVYSDTAKKKGGEKTYGGENLPDNSQIQPKYRDSGQWIAQPGSK